jgi:hypothetical protein
MDEFERERAVDRPRPEVETARTGDTASPAGPADARPRPLDAASVLHLQRTAGNASVVQMLADDEQRSPVHEVVGSGGGSPLEPGTRASMEQAFGRSFGDVRIHTGEAASASARSVGANAYTVGSDIVFRSGHGPGTPTFQRDIAHELEHVNQQQAGPVDGTEAAGGIRVSDPSDRFERAAEQRATEIVSGLSKGSGRPGDAGSVQRDVDDEALPPVQRQEMPEEEEDEEPSSF